MKDKYADIINLPRPRSKIYPPMPRANRAAQFMPFAALTGYEDAIKEEARLTERRIKLDPQMKEEINYKLNLLQEKIDSKSRVEIVYFEEDKSKEGGFYLSCFSSVKKIDAIKKIVIMEDGSNIVIDNILEIKGEIL